MTHPTTNPTSNISQLQQIDGGTVFASDPATGKPLFWFTRVTGSSKEFWSYYNWGQSGGYNPPSSNNPTSTWNLQFENVSFSDYCSFVNWIVQNYGVSESDLTGEQHVITPETCSQEDLQQDLTTA